MLLAAVVFVLFCLFVRSSALSSWSLKEFQGVLGGAGGSGHCGWVMSQVRNDVALLSVVSGDVFTALLLLPVQVSQLSHGLA